MLYVEPTTHKELSRPLVRCSDIRLWKEPHVIVRAFYVTPSYLGGEVVEADVMLSAKAYSRVVGRARRRQ